MSSNLSSGNSVCLRVASLSDATRLLAWRNDPATRAASHHSGEIAFLDHLDWLQSSLAQPGRRRIWIAEKAGVPVGTCRADLRMDAQETTWELSWTVAPEARGQGVAHKMLTELLTTFDAHFIAQVKKDNLASIKVAQGLGFVLEREDNGVLLFAKNIGLFKVLD
ncbi:GNAT family N-acetyltransferase [Marinomonas algarum]|uniref:GNAT family N-acetyltransferase n=1 Tax=Marinomonas algarum TaxID=2883105 RepID=A0A9X1LEH5_9GAMM|nr:GNAT family N-acetyltransferase [Marinomonas algarum]MCB5161486.1 GNAT family N-acetyltransferase [Marinomonas algarum]